MALTDEVFKKHLNTKKKSFTKTYNHYRPFDDPDYQYTLDKKPNVDHISKEKTLALEKINLNINDSTIKHKPNTKADTNQTQTRHKADTIGTLTKHKADTNQTQLEHKYNTEANTNWNTNITQLLHSETNINAVVGSQRKLLFYIYDLCKMNGNKITCPLNLNSLYENTFIEKGSIKTSLARLIQKSFLIREGIKSGRAGWVIFRIPDAVYQELFNNDVSLNLTQTRHKLDTKPNTEPNTNASIVSSSYINTTTTLPDDLKQIDCSPLSEIGFDESHIIQIHREHMQKPEISLSADIIQNSINALAFDLKYNNAINDFKRPPAVVLTYLLKKGQPYSSKTPEKVTTPREEAMRQYLLAQERKNLKNLEIEVRAKELALQDWLSNLSENELSEFSHNYESCPPGMPEKIYQTSKRKKATASAKEYFDTVVWPDKLKKILNEGETIKQT